MGGGGKGWGLEATLFGLSLAPRPMAVFVDSSLMLLASFAPTPFSALVSALLRVSLAFTSTGVNPSSLYAKGSGQT